MRRMRMEANTLGQPLADEDLEVVLQELSAIANEGSQADQDASRAEAILEDEDLMIRAAMGEDMEMDFETSEMEPAMLTTPATQEERETTCFVCQRGPLGMVEWGVGRRGVGCRACGMFASVGEGRAYVGEVASGRNASAQRLVTECVGFNPSLARPRTMSEP
ncbi:hypothetical protein BDK51DRAFT_27388 [Blyttiomyces helicus]|uniref:Uncharacterized protein n=1 Tax=Blyttiomyces helicus TaxID=388810 RepID=A0A4P9WMF0_9FUNG|nr:hypothetical protein BDK51DRAFT_27388 [Blyttiomyces helicus]|eukprot:RKO93385.1 hypothetical protein BDK51DRAFT_27388 [Blyttiomyces helicus]